MTLILKNISSKPLCAFFEITCSQVQMELHRRQFRVLWHEDKVKTKKLFLISAAQRKLKQQDNLGGWAGGRFPSLSQAVAYPSFWQSFLRKWKIVFHQHGHGTVILCSVGNACSPSVLGWWCLFLPYKSLVSWDAWLGLVESTGSRAPLRVCSEGFAARMPSHSLLLPSSSSRVLRGVSVSKVPPYLSSLFLATEAAFGTKFTTFSWFPEQIKAHPWQDTALNRGATTHCSKIDRTAALAVRRKVFSQGTKMFVWETSGV